MKIFRWLGIGLLVLIGVLAVNTWRYSAPEHPVPDIALPDVDGMDVAKKLARAVQFKTISHSAFQTEYPADFQRFIDWLDASFPNAAAAMEKTMIGGYTPLYRWVGSDASAPPVLLTGHYDVVPIAGDWSHDPFAGKIADGYVWGRGVLDDKGAIVAMMETADRLAAAGFQPPRDVYFSFGHDEEISGRNGAGKVTQYFLDNGIQLAWSLDEGSMILRDIISGLDKDVASINIAEKGYATVQIVAKDEGGHSSLPARETAVSKLAQALVDLQAKPVDGGLDDVSFEFFNALGPHFGFPEKVLFANQWLFKPVLEYVLSGANTTDAMLRSSKAPTMLQGSKADNVLPQEARAKVNFRVHPRDTVEDILKHVRDRIDNAAIEVIAEQTREASPVSDPRSEGFGKIAGATRAVFGDVIVVPGLTIAATDTRHYAKAANNSFRMNPFIFTGAEIALIHGKDERLSVENLAKAVQFYTVLLQNL